MKADYISLRHSTFLPSTCIYNQRLSGRQVDRFLLFVRKELIHRLSDSGASGEPVIVEQHCRAGRKTRIEEHARIMDRSVQVRIHMDETEKG